jgi:hypothetical protein
MAGFPTAQLSNFVYNIILYISDTLVYQQQAILLPFVNLEHMIRVNFQSHFIFIEVGLLRTNMR